MQDLMALPWSIPRTSKTRRAMPKNNKKMSGCSAGSALEAVIWRDHAVGRVDSGFS